MNKIKLSICIPTYNMGNFLSDTIKSIVGNLSSEISKNLEICISDNASTDNSSEVIAQWRQKTTIPIIYVKNEQNLGADANFLKVIEISTGDYCWFLGADDRIVTEKIPDIYNLCKKMEFDIILGDRINTNVSGDILGNQYYAQHQMIVTTDNFSDYLMRSDTIASIYSYISSIIFKRQKWNNITKEQTDIVHSFLGSSYVHAFVLLAMLKNKGKMNYLHDVIVINRRDNDSFLQGNYFNRVKIDFNYIKIIKQVFGEKSEEANQINCLLRKERKFVHFLKAKYLLKEENKKDFFNFIQEHDIAYKSTILYTPKLIIGYLLNIYELIHFKRFKKS